MVDQPPKEKVWHRYNMSNGTPKLVAPTIDAQWEEPCRPRPQDVSKYRECKMMGLSLHSFRNE